jgi:hypothetical protein
MWRNLFINLLAHETNPWEKKVPIMVKNYLTRIIGRKID